MERPYPEREHLNTPSDAYEALAEELRIYRDSDDFEEALQGLMALYDQCPLADSFIDYSSDLAFHIEEKIDSKRGEQDVDILTDRIYDGMLLGLHVAINRHPISAKNFIVNQSLMIIPSRGSLEDLAKDYEQDLNAQKQRFEKLSEFQQSTLFLSAERACEPYGAIYELYFALGVLKSVTIAESLLLKYSPPHRTV